MKVIAGKAIVTPFTALPVKLYGKVSSNITVKRFTVKRKPRRKGFRHFHFTALRVNLYGKVSRTITVKV